MNSIEIARAFFLINDVRRFYDLLNWFSNIADKNKKKRLRLNEHIELLEYINSLEEDDNLRAQFNKQSKNLTNKKSTQKYNNAARPWRW